MTSAAPNRKVAIAFKKRRTPARFAAANPALDYIPAVIVAAIAFVLLKDVGLNFLGPSGRRPAYQTFSALSATLFGLTMTTISILASNMDKPIGGSPTGTPAELRKGLARPMFGLLRRLGLSAGFSIYLLVADTAPKALQFAQPTLLALGVLIAAGAIRSLHLLWHLLLARTT